MSIARDLSGLLESECTIERLTVEGDRAVASVSHEGFVQRWFLVKTEAGWRFGDYEESDVGLRLSDILGAGGKAFDKLTDAIDAYRDCEWSDAIEALPSCGRLAPVLHPVWFAVYADALSELEYGRAALVVAADVKAEIPGVHTTRARAYNTIGEPERALACARKAIAIVGNQTEACYEAGRALLALGRAKEAEAMHLAGLAAYPWNGENVLGLFRALPRERKKVAAPHLLAIPSWFGWIAQELVDAEDWDALAAALEAYRGAKPGDPEVREFTIELRIGREEYAEAAGDILGFLPGVEDADDRKRWAEKYLDAMHSACEPLLGYERLSARDRDLAWSSLAASLADTGEVDDLRKLLALRRTLPEPGAAMAIWEVELAWIANRFEEVDLLVQEKARAIRASGDYEAGRAFRRQIRSLLRLKKLAEALEKAKALDDELYLCMAHAALGETKEAIAAFEEGVRWGHDPADFFKDDDAGPLLRDKAYDALRKKYR
jgi:tetratricopeptide (TPR) repeat protein